MTIRRLDEDSSADRRHNVKRTDALRNYSGPQGTVKLSVSDRYRLRQGKHRTPYTPQDKELVVIVIKIGNRKNACESAN